MAGRRASLQCGQRSSAARHGSTPGGEATIAEAIRRDLSSDLDVVPAGAADISSEGLDEILEALAASYAFVLVHASNWRSEPALCALNNVHKVVLVAPALRLPSALLQAREAMGGDPADVMGFVVSRDRTRVEHAA